MLSIDQNFLDFLLKYFHLLSGSLGLNSMFSLVLYNFYLLFSIFSDKWKGLLKHSSTNKCLMPDGSNSSANVLLAPCDVKDDRLLWTFDYDQKSKDSKLVIY